MTKTFIKELNQEFESEQEAFKALKENAEKIIEDKVSKQFFSHEKNVGMPFIPFKLEGESIKGFKDSDDYFNIVVNTTNVLDSHRDLHIKGIWNDGLGDTQGKNCLCVDHENTIEGTATRKEDIVIHIVDTTFKALGFDLEGETQALVYSFLKNSMIHEKAKAWLESGADIEASVKMRYTDIELALKSEDGGDEEELKLYLHYIDKIANKEDFENEIRYFWVVKKAINIDESSLVKRGSNPFTGRMKEVKKGIDIKELNSRLKVEKKEGLNIVELIRGLKK